MTSTLARLDRIAERYAGRSAVTELLLAVEDPNRGLAWEWGPKDRPYFVASISKLFTSAIAMQLRAEQHLALDTPVADILGEEILCGLVVHEDTDYAARITVRHLLAQNSGIPDYYEQRGPDGTTLAERMLAHDRLWSFDEFLDRARQLRSPFPPGTPDRALYSDTNFQLLGRIIETCTGQSFGDAVRERIIDPLGLEHTWLFTQDTVGRYGEVAPVRNRREHLHIPLTLASAAPDGGIVSTTTEQLRFLRAYTTGELFPGEYLDEMTAHWNRCFPGPVPLRYGLGVMRFSLPRWQSPFAPVPDMIGHAGSFGTVLFHDPRSGLAVAGTVNQTQPRRLPYPLLARISALPR